MVLRKAGKGWSPYLAGALTGLLAIGSAVATTRVTGRTAYLGASTTFVRAAGMIERQIWPENVEKNAYFRKEIVRVDWQFALVCGVFFGALVGALTGRSFDWNGVPERFVKRFSRRPVLRAGLAFIGGVIAMFGARLAGGCPSGQGLSGTMQLSVSGFVSVVCFFVGGVVVARKLYKGGPRE